VLVIDLYIKRYQVTKWISLKNVKEVKIKLTVKNNGVVNSDTYVDGRHHG